MLLQDRQIDNKNVPSNGIIILEEQEISIR
jgi:hypothetical protein